MGEQDIIDGLIARVNSGDDGISSDDDKVCGDGKPARSTDPPKARISRRTTARIRAEKGIKASQQKRR